MSLRSRVEQIARDTAIATANQIVSTRYQQIQNNSSPLGVITKIKNGAITVQTTDGMTSTVQTVGNRNFGVGSVGIVAGGILL